MSSRKPVFIHSLFRTGSTYLWNKFRQQSGFHCYFEPFHQELAFLETGGPSRWDSSPHVASSMRHPRLDREYMHEYRHLLRPGRPGVPFFKKSFSFDDFCKEGAHPEQKQYIDRLLAGAGTKTPLLQFNRSALRTGWFKNEYPDAIHLYLFRDPRRQFLSFLSLQEQDGQDIFLLMNLLVVSINQRKYPAFEKLAGRLPLFEYHAREFRREEMFYRYLLPFYSRMEQYRLHYCLWFAALLENLARADLLLNLDWLCRDAGYRNRAGRRLEETTGMEVDLSDAVLPPLGMEALPDPETGEIENEIRSQLLKMTGWKRAEDLARRFDAEDPGPDRTCLELWRELRQRDRPADLLPAERMAKQAVINQELTPRFLDLKNQARACRRRQLRTWLRKGHGSDDLKTRCRRLRMELEVLAAVLGIPPGETGRIRDWPREYRPARLDKRQWRPSAPITAGQGGSDLNGMKKPHQPGWPLVSVVTVVLNEVEALELTITSVLRQTYANVELVVIDGGSGKPTLDIIKKYEDRIGSWLSEPDRGIFDAMNKGIDRAAGDWIIFLNCGDRFYRDDTLQTVLDKDCQDADFIYGDTDFHGGDFRGVVKAWDFGILWKTMIFTHQSLLSRSEVLRRRRFNTSFRICADYNLIYNARADGLKFFYCGETIASFHPGFSEISRARMAWEKWRVVRRHRNDVTFHLFYLQLFLRRLVRDVLAKCGRRKKT